MREREEGGGAGGVRGNRVGWVTGVSRVVLYPEVWRWGDVSAWLGFGDLN